MVDQELAQKVVDFLNELIALDRPAIAALCNIRVPCSEALANHPTVQAGPQHGGYNVGMIGVLNGLCGAYPDTWGAIAAIFEVNGQTVESQTATELGDLIGFEIIPQRGSKTVTSRTQPETFEVSKITTEGGDIYYTRETDRSKLRILAGVKRIEDARMTEEEFAAIPTTEASRNFFAGLDQSTRSD